MADYRGLHLWREPTLLCSEPRQSALVTRFDLVTQEFDEGKHPRDERGRWTAGYFGGVPDHEQPGSGQAVVRHSVGSAEKRAAQLLDENPGDKWSLGHEEMHAALTYKPEGTRVMQRIVELQKDGKSVAAVNYHTDGSQSPVYINHLGSTGEVSRAGTAALEHPLRLARERHSGVELDAYPQSKAYYQKLGFHPGDEGDTSFKLSALEVPRVHDRVMAMLAPGK